MKSVALLAFVTILMLSTASLHADAFGFRLEQYAELNTSRKLPQYKKENPSVKSNPKTVEFIKFENGWRAEIEAFQQDDHPVSSLQMGWLANSEDLLIIVWALNYPKKTSVRKLIILKYQNDPQKCRQVLRMSFDAIIPVTGDFKSYSPFFSFDLKKNILIETVKMHVLIMSEKPIPLTKKIKHNPQHKFADYHAEIDIKYRLEYRLGENALKFHDAKMWYYTQKDDSIEQIGLYFFGQTWTPGQIKTPNPFLKDVSPAAKLPAEMEIQIAATREYFINFARKHFRQTRLQ